MPLEAIPENARTLNHVIEVEGKPVVMMTQGLAAVPSQLLTRSVMSLESKRAEIVAALDLLFVGF